MTTFIHTSDWHLGKPFASIEDGEKRALVRKARFDALGRLAEAVSHHEAAFVVVAGDLFDSPTPEESTVSAALSAIGGMGVPVYVIPGNHDHAGPESVWGQGFFAREQASMAPNLQVLLEPEPVEVEGAVLFPAPLAHRQQASDPTAWLRSGEPFADAGALPRVVLAHGSIQGFSSDVDEEGAPHAHPNLISLDRLPTGAFDYAALGDWHGAKQVDSKAWYAGTPEPDRFPKGEDHEQGHALVVRVGRGAVPSVEKIATGVLKWHVHDFRIDSESELDQVREELFDVLGNRAREDLLHLTLRGSLGLEARGALDEHLSVLRSRLLRLDLDDDVRLSPTSDELQELGGEGGDPLIANVATHLLEVLEQDPERARTAEIALRELYLATHE